jgi:hypothetical protein
LAKNIQITNNKKVRNAATSIAVAVQNEVNSNTIIFTLPRKTIDNIDLSVYHCYVDYENAKKENNRVSLESPLITNESITYTWILDNAATSVSGDFFIQITFEGTNFIWKSEKGKFAILDSIEFGKRVQSEYPLFLNQLLEQIDDIEERVTFIENNGANGDKNFVHNQIVSSANWVINHNLGKNPSFDIIDTGGNYIIGEPTYPSVNQLIIAFSSEFSGKAFLN